MERYQSQLVDYSIAKSSASTCESCSSKPTFIETTHSLSYTCGKTTKDCGVQQTIDLARYENVVKSVPYETPYNDSVLQSLLNIQPPKHPESTYDQVQSDFETQNSLDDKKSRVESLMDEIKKLSREKSSKDPSDYIQHSKRISDLYGQIRDIVEEVDPFVILQKPKFTSIESATKKPVKEKPVEEKPVEKTLSKGSYVRWLHRKSYKYGIVQKVNPKKCIVESEGSEYIVPHTKLDLISENTYDQNTNKKQYLKVGSSVSWLSKSGSVMNGTVKKLNKVKAILLDSDKNEYVIDYKLIII
tara:strand:- start:430 stop:1332 length:903 start_codon:yes stop_codon:yes gene_type:complete